MGLGEQEQLRGVAGYDNREGVEGQSRRQCFIEEKLKISDDQAEDPPIDIYRHIGQFKQYGNKTRNQSWEGKLEKLHAFPTPRRVSEVV
ncbi:hypothetical protein A3L04_08930 [Thermococcus chitonophagus]|uniref:Uncharacterized protein n=1 Tax=Thermococcus chitonophagus TaxID=54262 RepID=A0A2Z2NCH0_9EURY|nr:hypothetical protein A3L04_08930 [Thermococcus chitonophagus]